MVDSVVTRVTPNRNPRHRSCETVVLNTWLYQNNRITTGRG